MIHMTGDILHPGGERKGGLGVRPRAPEPGIASWYVETEIVVKPMMGGRTDGFERVVRYRNGPTLERVLES